MARIFDRDVSPTPQRSCSEHQSGARLAAYPRRHKAGAAHMLRGDETPLHAPGTQAIQGRGRRHPPPLHSSVNRSDLLLRVPPATWIMTVPELLNLSVPHSTREEWAVPCAYRGSSHRLGSGTDKRPQLRRDEGGRTRALKDASALENKGSGGCACTPRPTESACALTADLRTSHRTGRLASPPLETAVYPGDAATSRSPPGASLTLLLGRRSLL